MAKLLKLRRGTAAQHDDSTGFTGVIGEVTVDTTNKTLRVHDESTKGGIKLAKSTEVPTIINSDTYSGASTSNVNSATGSKNYVDTQVATKLASPASAGTVGASEACQVDSNKDITGFRNVTLTGELDAATGDFSGDVDIDGTANLDDVDIDGSVDIDGAVQVDNTITVGANDTGHDVKFFGATSGAYMLWDEDVDDLILAGAARAVVPEGNLVLGSTAVTSTATELNQLDGKTAVNTVDAQTVTGIKSFDAAARSVTTTLTDSAGGTVTPDFANSNDFKLVAGGSSNTRALGNPSNLAAGQSGVIWFTQGSGSNALTYGTKYHFAADTPPTLSTTANYTDALCYSTYEDPSDSNNVKIAITAIVDVR